MIRNTLTTYLGRAGLVAFVASSPYIARAQVNCETIPPGPARTNCYIGLSQINRQKSEIAGGAAQQQTDSAIYRQLTGRSPKTKWHRGLPDR